MHKTAIYLHPAVLFAMTWVVLVLAASISRLEFYPLSGLFYLYLFSAIGAFAIAALAGSWASMNLRVFRRIYEVTEAFALRLDARTVVNLYLVAMTFSLIVQALDHAIIVGPGWWQPMGLIIYRISIAELAVPANFRWVAILNYFFFSAVPVLWMFWHDMPRVKKLLFVMLLLAFIYLSTARSSLFTIVLIGSAFVLHHRPRITLVLLVGLLLFFSFQLIGSLVGKDSFEAFWIYLFAPTFALDQILAGLRADLPGTYYSFRFFLPFLEKLSLIPPQPSNLLSYYETPYATNVYTVFGPYVLDFGIVASVLIITAFGLASGMIFGLQQRFASVPYLKFLSALSLTILVLGVFHDYYTSSGYVWFSLFFSLLLFPRSYPASARAETERA